MKALLISVLMFAGSVAFASECSRLQEAVSDCAYNNQQLSGAELKAACQGPLKAFIAEYNEHQCGATKFVGGVDLQIPLDVVAQRLILTGKRRDEERRLFQQRADAEAAAKQAQTNRAFESLEIK